MDEQHERSARPGRGPLALLCLAMTVAGLFLVLSGFEGPFGRWFGQWRERGISSLSEGVLDIRLNALIAMMAGILGASLIGKWLSAWALLRYAPPRAHAWSRRALFAALGVLGLFDFCLLMIWGVPAAEAATELLVPMFVGMLLSRETAKTANKTAEISEPQPNAQRPLAWRSLEAFAWLNVALGLSLSVLVFAPPFALYRVAMAEQWFPVGAPTQLDAWLRYGYGAIGVAFAGQFWILAAIARHAAQTRWAWRTYGGTVLAWFLVDSAACLAHGAWFNIMWVNLPALALGGALLVWARPTRA